MKINARRAAAIAAIAAGTAAVIGVARSPGLRASFSAAYKAFRDPALVEASPSPLGAQATAGAACAPRGDADLLLDAKLANDFKKAADQDLEDTAGAALSSLTMPDLRVPVTRRTMRYVRFFAKTDAGRAAFLQRFRRAGTFRSHIEHALREAGLPEDLVWVAAIESGFDPRAVSPAGAAGLWQFMPHTGALYGLHQSPYVDERKSIVRATTAAVAHLRDLYERFGRWDLALAAYNAGHDGVLQAIDRALATRSAQDRGKAIEFAELAEAGFLPEETSNYVPQISAFAIVASNRARFGLDAPDLAPAPSLDLGELAFPEGTRLRTIARAAGIPTSLLRDYNPELLKDRLPPTGGDYLVHLPADRVQRTLAAFPAYLDNEVLGTDEPDAPGSMAAEAIAAGSDAAAPDPLPRRPSQIGHNRLPEFAVPGASLLSGASEMGGFGSKLPLVLVGGGLGWQRTYGGDPLGVMSPDARVPAGVKGRELAVEKQLGFLDGPRAAAQAPDPFERFTLTNGVTVHLRQDTSAPRVAITVRLAGSDAPVPLAEGVSDAARPELSLGAGETRHTITVAPRDIDLGVEIAAARLRMLLAEAGNEHLAEQRRRASEPRRRALAETPYGQAFLVLGGALFPKGHPLEGTVIGAWEDAALARDFLLSEALRQERSATRASITLVGGVRRPQVQKQLEQLLGAEASPLAEAPVAPHPREERLVVEDGVPSPRTLYGWIAPGEGDAWDAPMRVAMEILIGPKQPRLDRALKENPQLASLVKGALDIGPRASIAAIEVTPAIPHDAGEVERRLDAELDALGTTGPSAQEVATAKAFLKARLQKELASATGPIQPNAPRSAVSARIRRTLRPGNIERLLEALDDVSPAAVKTVVKRTLTRANRVVVTTVPRAPRE